MTPWERYFLVGRRAGCPKDQMQRFERADVILQERQLVASAKLAQGELLWRMEGDGQ